MTGRKFEVTFTLDIPREEAWANLAGDGPKADEAGTLQWWLPGFEAPGNQVEVDPGRLLRVTKAVEPCKDTEIVVVMEDAGTGTRITIVQSGFPAWIERNIEAITIGWTHIVADFALYVRTRQRGKRHIARWGSPGIEVRDSLEGPVVTAVRDDSYGKRVGLAEGDIVLTVGGVPMANSRDFYSAVRLLRTGEPVVATWIRGREPFTGSATF